MAAESDWTGGSRVDLELRGPVDHLRLVWQTGEALLEDLSFRDDPEGNRFNTLVAIQEIVTNVLRHAHQLNPNLPVRLEFEADARQVLVRVMDRGAPFDPRRWLDERDDGKAREDLPEEPGGFGILIAALVMDQIDYERRDGWNVLTMIRRSDADRSPADPVESAGEERRS